MNNLSGGYIMVDLSSPNKVKQLEKAAALNKPLLVYYQDGTTEWGKVTVTYETIDDVEVPTYHITTANGFVTVEADGDTSARPLNVEGDAVLEEITGVTFTYAKWSLSGTHLMFVLAGNIANGTVLANNTLLATFNIPEFIYNKIYPTFSNVVEIKNIPCYNTSFATQTLAMQERKHATEKQILLQCASLTLTDDRSFRMQFDLLIDNE